MLVLFERRLQVDVAGTQEGYAGKKPPWALPPNDFSAIFACKKRIAQRGGIHWHKRDILLGDHRVDYHFAWSYPCCNGFQWNLISSRFHFGPIFEHFCDPSPCKFLLFLLLTSMFEYLKRLDFMLFQQGRDDELQFITQPGYHFLHKGPKRHGPPQKWGKVRKKNEPLLDKSRMIRNHGPQKLCFFWAAMSLPRASAQTAWIKSSALWICSTEPGPRITCLLALDLPQRKN